MAVREPSLTVNVLKPAVFKVMGRVAVPLISGNEGGRSAIGSFEENDKVEE